MKKTKQINYYLLIAAMTINSYLPIIWTTLKEDVPFGWYNFFENFRLWRKLIAEKNIKLINFWKDSFWCDLNFYRE